MKSPKRTPEQKRAIYCVVNGHSRIIETCFGYIHCARCGQQIGDALGGVYDGSKNVIVGHACKICKANWKKLTRTDLAYVPREKLKGYGKWKARSATKEPQ